MKPKNITLALLSIGAVLIFCSLYGKHINYMPTFDKHLFDLGNGLITFSLTMMLYLFIHHIDKKEDFHKIYSLKKWMIIISTNVFWLLLIPGTYLYYALRAKRGYFPLNADTIMIPFSEQVICILLMLLPLNALLFLSLKKTSHPTQFSVERAGTARKKSYFAFFLRIFYDVLIIIHCGFLIFFVFDGNHVAIVVCIGLIHNLFSLKFGKINSIMRQI